MPKKYWEQGNFQKYFYTTMGLYEYPHAIAIWRELLNVSVKTNERFVRITQRQLMKFTRYSKSTVKRALVFLEKQLLIESKYICSKCDNPVMQSGADYYCGVCGEKRKVRKKGYMIL